MVSNQDILSSRLPSAGRTNFLIKHHFYPCLHQTGIFPETKAKTLIICKRRKIQWSCWSWWPAHHGLLKSPLWLMGCLAWHEISQSYIIICLGPFFSIHSWTIDWMEGKPASFPWGDEEEKKWGKDSFPATDLVPSHSLQIQTHQSPSKTQPKNNGKLRKARLLNCGIGEDSWESLGLQGDPTSPS